MQYIITLPEAIKGQHLKRLTEAGVVVTPITATGKRPDMAQTVIDTFTGLIDAAVTSAEEAVKDLPEPLRSDIRKVAQAQALKLALCQFSAGVSDAGHSKH